MAKKLKHSFTGSISSSSVALSKSTKFKTGYPYFIVQHSVSQLNVTGDGLVFLIAFDTVVKDVGSDFSSNIFTAPITGIYRFWANIGMVGVLVGHTWGRSSFSVNSGFLHEFWCANPGAMASAGNTLCINGTLDIPLTSGDTVGVRLQLLNGGKSVDLRALAGLQFSGQLISL